MKSLYIFVAAYFSVIGLAHASESCIAALNSSKEIMGDATTHESENGGGPLLVIFGHDHAPDVTVLNARGIYAVGSPGCDPITSTNTNVYNTLSNFIHNATHRTWPDQVKEQLKGILKICSTYTYKNHEDIKKASLAGLEALVIGNKNSSDQAGH